MAKKKYNKPETIEQAYIYWTAYQDVERMFGNDSDLMDFPTHANLHFGFSKEQAQEYLDGI